MGVKTQEVTGQGEGDKEGRWGQLSVLGLQKLVGDTDETDADAAWAVAPGRVGVMGGSGPGLTRGRAQEWEVGREGRGTRQPQ